MAKEQSIHSKTLPGKKDEVSVGDIVEKVALVSSSNQVMINEDGSINESAIELKTDGSVEASADDKRRMDRLYIHIEWITQELRVLLNGGNMTFPLRRIAAENGYQFIGDVVNWPPIKIMQDIIQKARDKAGLPPVRRDLTLRHKN